MHTKKETGLTLLSEVIENLDNPKFSLFTSIQKLNRIGKLLNESKLILWTEIYLGNESYNLLLKNVIDKFIVDNNRSTKQSKEVLDKAVEELKIAGIEIGVHITNQELTCKGNESSGGFSNIGFIEEKYNDLVKTKRGNDGTYYKSGLSTTLSLIRSLAYKKASFYHKKYAYDTLPESNFDILKNKVEDVLLDIDPELAEMLMLAFKSVSSSKQEEWSQALTSCRRFFEKLSNHLYPESNEIHNGRSLSKENYINRIWAYMDKTIESKSNKDIAKSQWI